MTKTVTRLVIAALVAAALALAVARSPQSFFPAVSIEVPHAGGAVTLEFVFGPQSALGACERLNGRIARSSLSGCPQCRITRMTCDTSLTPAELQLAGGAPLAFPSGRMANGDVAFRSASAQAALDTCRETQVRSAALVNPVRCYASGEARPPYPKPSLLTPGTAGLVLAALLASWFVCWLIIRYEHLHAHLSHDPVGGGPQKYHDNPTPRIGGIAVLAGLLAAAGVALVADGIEVERPFGLLLLAALPAFLGGLLEDVTKKFGVLERLMLTMLSGAAGAWLVGAVLNRLDVPGFDQALAWFPFAVAFTAFAVAGVANAINIIDGYNGLAGGFSVIVLAAMAFIANRVGDELIFHAAIALAGAVFGFLLWNWPGGRIFLGDAGAYVLGFLSAELAVLLVSRNPDVSPWFPLAVMIYPVFETFFSIYRKYIMRRRSPGKPDGLHMHMLVYKRVIRKKGVTNTSDRNSRVAKYFWIPALLVAAWATLYYSSTQALIFVSTGFCVAYVSIYFKLMRFRRK